MSTEKIEMIAGLTGLVLISLLTITLGYYGKKHSAKLLLGQNTIKPTRKIALYMIYQVMSKVYFVAGIAFLSVAIIAIAIVLIAQLN